MTDPVLLIAAVLALPLGFIVRRARPAALGLLAPLLLLLRPNGYLPSMFVIGMLPFAALLVAFTVDWLWRSGRAARVWRWRRRVGARLYRTEDARRSRLLEFAPSVLSLVVVAALIVVVAPRWAAGDRTAMAADAAVPSHEAVTWLTRHASRHAYLLGDDSVWTDLIDRGFLRSHTGSAAACAAPPPGRRRRHRRAVRRGVPSPRQVIESRACIGARGLTPVLSFECPRHIRPTSDKQSGGAVLSSSAIDPGGADVSVREGDADVSAREGDEVSVRYATTLQDGTPCESNWHGDPLAFVLGEGAGLPTLAQAVIGLTPGMRATVLLPPEEAYGAWRAEAIEEVPVALFGECAPEAGTEGTMVDVDGKRFPCRVVAISSDQTTATVDFNHPLAGQSLNCDVELLEIISRAGAAQAN